MGGKLKYVFYTSLVLEILSGMYLLLFDQLLQQTAFIQWAALLLYIAIVIVLGMAYYTRQSKKALLGIAVFSILAIIVMLLDAALGLPLSQDYAPGTGWSYLFGFGVAPGSFFGTSLAFTLMLVFSIVLAAVSYLIYKKDF